MSLNASDDSTCWYFFRKAREILISWLFLFLFISIILSLYKNLLIKLFMWKLHLIFPTSGCVQAGSLSGVNNAPRDLRWTVAGPSARSNIGAEQHRQRDSLHWLQAAQHAAEHLRWTFFFGGLKSLIRRTLSHSSRNLPLRAGTQILVKNAWWKHANA